MFSVTEVMVTFLVTVVVSRWRLALAATMGLAKAPAARVRRETKTDFILNVGGFLGEKSD